MTARRGAALQITGRSGTFSMQRPSDPSEIGRRARRFLQDPANWRGSTKTGSADDKALSALKQKVPQAFDLFAPHLLLAPTRRAASGMCNWCVARMLAALAGESEPVDTEAVRALLGVPCGACRSRLNLAAARRRAERQATAAAAAREVIARIEAQDGKLAAAIARLGYKHHWPAAMVAAAVADVVADAKRPAAVPGISAPALRPLRPPAALQRPATGRSGRRP